MAVKVVVVGTGGIAKRHGEALVENENALLYSNKLKTARYFLEAIIPQYHALLEGGRKQNFDALEITF